jgi:site-specific recombinase XerD
MHERLNEYLEYSKLRGYSHATIKGRRNTLERFIQSIKDKPLDEVMLKDIEAYRIVIAENLTKNSVLCVLNHIRGFYRFLHKQGYLLNDLSQLIDLPGRNVGLTRDVPDEKKTALLLNQPDLHTYHGIRDKAVLELIYSTGIRSKETRDLKVGDIDLKERTLAVRSGKGGRGRIVPVGQKAIESLDTYLKITRPHYVKNPEEDHLFVSRLGRSPDYWFINDIIRKYCEQSIYLNGITPHLLRHACALHMLRGGASIESISELLGHKRLSTTQIYTRIYPKDLKAMHAKYHPRERVPRPTKPTS